jgi:hypothetical protein
MASKWQSDECVSSQRFIRVRHSGSGEIGYRSLRWESGHPKPYGSVYDGPECSEEAGNSVLLRVNALGILPE